MRINLLKRHHKEHPGKKECAVRVRQLTDEAEILSYLEKERSYSAAAIAHLEVDLAEASKWYLATEADKFALCLISRSMAPTYLFALGSGVVLDGLLGCIKLPGEVYITCQPQHLDAIEGHYGVDWRCVTKRMIVIRESFSPVEEEAVQLRPSQIGELNSLYRLQGNSVFSSRQIRRGVFYGLWRENQLAAVAGTHIISPTYGIACVGNVMTHPAYRNQGLATICTSAVTADLLDYCTEVVLSVEPQNAPAIRAYANLGYKDDCMIVEAFGHRRGLAGAIIATLWAKLGFGTKHSEGVQADG